MPRSPRHKYGAITTTVDGIRFASKAEAQRYAELRLLEKAGEIRELSCQPRFPLFSPERGSGGPYGRFHVGDYVADFRYRQGPNGVLVIEDVKGMKTALYRWKKKHFEAQYGLSITEISKASRRGAGRRKPSMAVPPSKPKTRNVSKSNGGGLVPPQDAQG